MGRAIAITRTDISARELRFIAKLCETGYIATTTAEFLSFLTDVARARSHACRRHNRRGLWLGLGLGLTL